MRDGHILYFMNNRQSFASCLIFFFKLLESLLRSDSYLILCRSLQRNYPKFSSMQYNSLVYIKLVLMLVIWRCTRETVVTCLESKQKQLQSSPAGPLAAELLLLQQVCRGVAVLLQLHVDCRCETGSASGSYCLFEEADSFSFFLGKSKN